MSALATDSFDRADGGLGANWTVLKGSWSISGNKAVPGSFSTPDASAIYSGVTWPNDQYAKAKCTVTGTSGSDAGIGVCVRAALNAGSFNGYVLAVDHAASGNVGLFKNTGPIGTYTHLATATQAFTDGDTFELQAQGTTITVKYNGTTIGAMTTTDSSLATGSAGLYFSTAETSASANDWEGGDFSGATTAYKDTPTRFKLNTPGVFKDTATRFKLLANGFKHTFTRFRIALAFPVHYYHTTFPATENPISEGSIWVNAGSDGLGWKDIRTTTNKAFGTQDGNQAVGVYNDSVAILRGTFGKNQRVTATAFNTLPSGAYYAEAELWGRGRITPNNTRGYEVLFSTNSASQTQGSYVEIAKWLGPVGGAGVQFVSLTGGQVALPGGLAAGDVASATFIDDTITAYRNGVQVAQVTDSVGLSGTAPYVDGNPGLGHWLNNNGATGDPTLYGFSEYTAETIYSYHDTPTRFRLAALKYAHTFGRFLLRATAFKDTPTRFRLASVVQFKDTPTRFRLNTLAAFKDTPTRFRLASIATYRHTVGRFALSAAAFKDTPTRARISILAYKFTPTRFIVQLANQAFRDSPTRFRLRSATTYKDTPTRALLQALTYRHTPSRVRLAASAFKHTPTRFVLNIVTFQGFKDTRARVAIRAQGYSHSHTRFALTAAGPTHTPNYREYETDLTLPQYVYWT